MHDVACEFVCAEECAEQLERTSLNYSFQVSFNLKVILYVAILFQNNVTEHIRHTHHIQIGIF